jgi:lipocalin
MILYVDLCPFAPAQLTGTWYALARLRHSFTLDGTVLRVRAATEKEEEGLEVEMSGRRKRGGCLAPATATLTPNCDKHQGDLTVHYGNNTGEG